MSRGLGSRAEHRASARSQSSGRESGVREFLPAGALSGTCLLQCLGRGTGEGTSGKTHPRLQQETEQEWREAGWPRGAGVPIGRHPTTIPLLGARQSSQGRGGAGPAARPYSLPSARVGPGWARNPQTPPRLTPATARGQRTWWAGISRAPDPRRALPRARAAASPPPPGSRRHRAHLPPLLPLRPPPVCPRRLCPRRLRAGSGCAGGDGGAAASAPNWRSGPARGRGPRWMVVGGEARSAPKPCPPFRRCLLPPCSIFTRNVETHKHPTCPHRRAREWPATPRTGAGNKAFSNNSVFSKSRLCLDMPGAALPQREALSSKLFQLFLSRSAPLLQQRLFLEGSIICGLMLSFQDEGSLGLTEALNSVGVSRGGS